MSKSLISADGSSGASPPWKVCLEEGEESLCDTVLCCIFLVMRCVRLRCVWFCVLLLDLGSQALVYACVSSCVPPHGGELQSISCCGPPVLEDDWCIV